MVSLFFLTGSRTAAVLPLSLHDALPIYDGGLYRLIAPTQPTLRGNPRLTFNNANHTIARDAGSWRDDGLPRNRSEEHTSELQSLRHLVCRLLLEKKNWHGALRCRVTPTQ